VRFLDNPKRPSAEPSVYSATGPGGNLAEVRPETNRQEIIRDAVHFAVRREHPPVPHAQRPRILLYSHDTFGLGNIRRTLLLADDFVVRYPGASILIITGSPMIHAFPIPKGVDYIKLPCLDRVGAERYEPRFLGSCSAEVKAARSAILKESILGFAPDLMIVDKRPSGVDGELLDTLSILRACGMKTKLVLGIRDILDAPERTREVLANSGSFTIIDHYYDEVWIYGTESIFATAREYAFPDSVLRKTKYVGYLKRPTRHSLRSDGPPRVLVTTGGGGDGSEMIDAYLSGLSTLARSVALRSTVVFGPQMPPARRQELLRRYGHFSDVEFLDFVPDLTKHYAESDVVVSQAGYNTVCELLSFSQRAILVPRAEPVLEQLIRARLLAERGYFDVVEPKDLTPESLIAAVLRSINTEAGIREAFDLDGLPRIRERISDLLREPSKAAQTVTAQIMTQTK
jgi:predicted glycosyltransferase